MSNVLINCVSAGSGGALTYLINLVPMLIEKSKKDNVKVYLLLKNEQYKLIGRNFDESVIFAPALGGYKRFLWEYFKLPTIIKNYKIDLIFTPYQIARISGDVRNIVMFRNMEPFTFHRYSNTFKNSLRNHILKFKTKQTIRNSDRVVAVSDYVRDVILENKLAGDDYITRIYHGRNTRFTADKGERDREILLGLGVTGEYIFTCGSLFPYRKCEDVISAFSEMKPTGAKLIVAGTGNDEQYLSLLKGLIDQHDLSDSVLLVGHVSLDEMIILYRNCNIFVTSTETEACPNIAIEAMSSGCNILSSDVLPLPEMFRESAVYYEHGNVGQLSIKMREMFAKEKGVNNKALSIIESFTWDKCADETYKLIIRELDSI